MAQNNLEELYEEYLQFALDLGRKVIFPDLIKHASS